MNSDKLLEFILVTGANASGKTTLIGKNRHSLEYASFRIIIPIKFWNMRPNTRMLPRS